MIDCLNSKILRRENMLWINYNVTAQILLNLDNIEVKILYQHRSKLKVGNSHIFL